MLRRALVVAAGLVVLLVAAGAGFGCCALSAPGYHGPVSDHFDGKTFHQAGRRMSGFGGMLRWMRTRKPGAWPDWIDEKPGPKPPTRVDDMRVTFVNHATVLLQMDGKNILTDPIWSERASPVSFAGPKRVRPPGIRFEDLPPIDVVLISHNHYDHMDVATLERLRDAFHPVFVTGLGNDEFLASKGIEATALDWWGAAEVSGLTITSVPSQHFSNRGLCDRDETLWTGFVVDSPKVGRAYFAGDTAYGPHFAEIGRRFPGIRVAMLPIGAYRPQWFMGGVHTSPAQAVQAQKDLGARVAVGIHFGTFRLADDGYDEPVRDLLTALDHEHPAPVFWALGFGEGRDIP